MNKPIIALIVIVLVAFIISETIAAKLNQMVILVTLIQQFNLDSDGKNIVVTWLESNKTNANSTPTISVSNEDFWKIFGPLFELSTNTTRE